jgi:hypothetical protein
LAPFTLITRATLKAHTDTLANCEVSRCRAYGGNRADHLMAGHERECLHPQLVIDQVQIRVADSAMSYGYVNFAGS